MGMKLLKGAGYGAFFVFALVFWTLVGFPDEELTDATRVHLTNMFGVPVQIERVSLTGLVSLEVKEAVIRLPRKESKTPSSPAKASDSSASKAGKSGKGETDKTKKAPEKKPKKAPLRMIDIQRLAFDTGIGDVLWASAGRYEPEGGERTFSLEGEVQGGTFTDTALIIDQDKHTIGFKMERLEGLRLGGAGLLKGLTGFDIRADLDAQIDVAVAVPKAYTKGESHVLAKVVGGAFGRRMELKTVDLALTLRNGRIVAPVIESKRMGTEYLTDVKLGDLKVVVSLKPLSEVPGYKSRRSARRKDAMVLHVSSLDSDSPEIAIKVDKKSTIRLRKGRPLSQGTLDLHLGIQLKPSFINKKAKNANGEVGQHNKKIELFAKYDPTLKRAYKNGVIGVYCRGRVSKPKCGIERSRVVFESVAPSSGGDKRNKPRVKPRNERVKDARARPKARPRAPKVRSQPARPVSSRPPRAANPPVKRAVRKVRARPQGDVRPAFGRRVASDVKRPRSGIRPGTSVSKRSLSRLGKTRVRSPTPDDEAEDNDEEDESPAGDDDSDKDDDDSEEDDDDKDDGDDDEEDDKDDKDDKDDDDDEEDD